MGPKPPMSCLLVRPAEAQSCPSPRFPNDGVVPDFGRAGAREGWTWERGSGCARRRFAEPLHCVVHQRRLVPVWSSPQCRRCPHFGSACETRGRGMRIDRKPCVIPCPCPPLLLACNPLLHMCFSGSRVPALRGHTAIPAALAEQSKHNTN